MDTRVTLPLTFTGVLNEFIGKNIGIACTEGRMAYIGPLTSVSKGLVTIFEKEIYHNITFKRIFLFRPQNDVDNFPITTTFNKEISELFKKYEHFLNQKVTITPEAGRIWEEIGVLKHIGSDYFVTISQFDNKITFVYAGQKLNLAPQK